MSTVVFAVFVVQIRLDVVLIVFLAPLHQLRLGLVLDLFFFFFFL